METDIKTVASTVKRSTRDLNVIALCEFILMQSVSIPSTKTSGECPECKKRRAQAAARIAKFRGKTKRQ